VASTAGADERARPFPVRQSVSIIDASYPSTRGQDGALPAVGRQLEPVSCSRTDRGVDAAQPMLRVTCCREREPHEVAGLTGSISARSRLSV
jgi:hypothetical protein